MSRNSNSNMLLLQCGAMFVEFVVSVNCDVVVVRKGQVNVEKREVPSHPTLTFPISKFSLLFTILTCPTPFQNEVTTNNHNQTLPVCMPCMHVIIISQNSQFSHFTLLYFEYSRRSSLVR